MLRFNYYLNCLMAFAVLFSMLSCAYSQSGNPAKEVIAKYGQYKEPSLSVRRITRSHIEPLIQELKQRPEFKVKKIGESIEGRDLSLVSLGSGDISVLLWSQMHGDESTATMAIFDLFNFFQSEDFEEEKNRLLQEISLHFLPMLNPDGAAMFQRRNALGVDINRDALRLQTPEGKILKRIRDSLDADWGFNLHDQSKYYNPENIPKPASISFLAPAYDHEKSVNKKRADAMQLIVKLNQRLQDYIPGQVARYNDEFEPRAFGDNIQKWGTRTILIESGGNYSDPEKQEIRRMNFIAILSAFFSIADKGYEAMTTEAYNGIPENDRQLFDLKLTGLTYKLKGKDYILDLGINHNEVFARNRNGFYYRGSIADQGDLSTNFAYKSVDVSGYRLVPGKVYPRLISHVESVGRLDFNDLLSEGISYVQVQDLPRNKDYFPYPVQLVPETFKPSGEIGIGRNPTFFLKKDGKLEFAVINGFFHELGTSTDAIKNGILLK